MKMLMDMNKMKMLGDELFTNVYNSYWDNEYDNYLIDIPLWTPVPDEAEEEHWEETFLGWYSFPVWWYPMWFMEPLVLTFADPDEDNEEWEENEDLADPDTEDDLDDLDEEDIYDELDWSRSVGVAYADPVWDLEDESEQDYPLSVDFDIDGSYGDGDWLDEDEEEEVAEWGVGSPYNHNTRLSHYKQLPLRVIFFRINKNKA